jgi:beta-lactamase class A
MHALASAALLAISTAVAQPAPSTAPIVTQPMQQGAPPVATQPRQTAATTTPVQARAAQLALLFSNTPPSYNGLFSPGFLQAVPQLGQLIGQLKAQYGRVLSQRQTSGDADSGEFDFVFERGYTVPAKIGVNPNPPNLVEGFWMGEGVPTVDNLQAILPLLRQLHGQVSFQVKEWTSQGTRVLAELNPETSLAVGSAAKLYIAGAVIRAVETEKHAWTDVVSLEPSLVSLPSGLLQDWPPTSPLTLHSLTALMLSQSDNTAADRLAALFGRPQLEKMLYVQGNQHPERSIPFLTTLEAFKLKYGEKGTLSTYASSDAEARRAILDGSFRKLTREALVPVPQPTAIDTVGWFASAGDLNRALDFIRGHTESGSVAQLRQLLGINLGLPVRRSDFSYVGYKGGAESGVLSVAYLLQRRNGTWVTLSAVWNDSQRPLEHDSLYGPLERVLPLLAR